MLSAAAFNALLKTLEEPPPHVKFVFATTDVQKVLPTILSRCQRFDLKPIPVELIVGRLKQIAAGGEDRGERRRPWPASRGWPTAGCATRSRSWTR